MWQDALRVCKDYSPNLLAEIQNEYDREMAHNVTRSFIHSVFIKSLGDISSSCTAYSFVTFCLVSCFSLCPLLIILDSWFYS